MAKQPSSNRSWNRLWQVPLLVVGLGAFGFGLRTLVRNVRRVPFETHVADIRTLLERKEYTRAIDQINYLANHTEQPRQIGELHALAGEAYFAWQRELPGPVRGNYEQVVSQYATAEKYGVPLTLEAHERIGLSALALDDAPKAIAHLEMLIAAEPAHLPRHARSLVAAYLADRQEAKALATLERLLGIKDLGVDERVWALAKRIEMTLGTPDVDRPLAQAKAAVGGIAERDPAGTLLTWIGRAEFERGDLDAAGKDLADARSRFVVHNLDDGRAALLLAKIAQTRGKLAEAGTLYQEVITSHAGSSLMAAARLGRAQIAALRGQVTEAMVEDYRFAARAVQESAAPSNGAQAGRKPEMVGIDQIRASLLANYQSCQRNGQLESALLFLQLQKEAGEPETAAHVYREASTRERRADELLAESRTTADGPRREAARGQAIKLYGEAAEMYRRHAELSTLDDTLFGASLWRAAGLFDRAGQLETAIATYEKFVVQRPRDARVPEGLHAIGMLYESLGKFDRAATYYRRNIAENPKTPASYLSTVQLARCYMAMGEPEFKKAEAALLSLVQDNRDLLPTANEFRVSLFALGELYYKSARWGDAILRLEESITRYPEDPAVPRARFWLAECYKKSAGEIAEAIRKDPAIAHRDRLESARQDRLRKSAGLFEEVVATLDKEGVAGIDEQYVRLSQVNRAECFFELGEYATAVKLYDAVATRYAQNLTAVEAYVQIVNAYLAMKETAQAAAAAERARWALKRIPEEAFGHGPLGLTRGYYEKLLSLGRQRAAEPGGGGSDVGVGGERTANGGAGGGS